MPALSRRVVAELFGTFAFVFLGCASVVVNAYPGTGGGLLGIQGIAMVHGIALAVMVTATMAISGGVLNPAITIGLVAARRLDVRSAAGYLAAQLAGAVLGALAVKAMYPGGVARLVSLGTPLISATVTMPQAIGIEALLTFLLTSVVLGTAVSASAPRVGGFAIGLTVFVCVMIAAPLTGAAMNPARAFGPALVSGIWTGHAAYWVGPILGAIAAGLLWDRALMPPRETAAAA